MLPIVLLLAPPLHQQHAGWAQGRTARGQGHQPTLIEQPLSCLCRHLHVQEKQRAKKQKQAADGTAAGGGAADGGAGSSDDEDAAPAIEQPELD